MVAIGKSSISDLPSVWFDGMYRVLACLPETPESVAAFPKFGEGMAAPLDPSQWQEIDLSWYHPPILDQGMSSSCVGHGTCSGMEMCWLQSGKPLREFSPWFVYGLVNGGRDQGARISDALQALQSKGIAPKEDVPPGTIQQSQFPQQAFTDAQRFKLLQAYHCPTFESVCSAISTGFICPVGLYVGNNFGQLDSDGVAPLPAGGGGGHCVLGVGLKKHSTYGWVIKFQNSWGTRFGQQGYAYLRKESFQFMQIDGFAIQSVSDDPQQQDPSNVPVVGVANELGPLWTSAVNFGFSTDWIGKVLKDRGADALATAVEATRQGLTTNFVEEALQTLGLDGLRLIVERRSYLAKN